MKLSDEHFQNFLEQGFIVVEGFYPEEIRARVSEAVRRDLPPWEQLADNPPEQGLLTDDFPYEQMLFNEFIIDWDLIQFVQRVLETEDIHFRYAHNWARYPCPSASPPKMHVDNGNNSLLPPCNELRYGQISTWYFPEEVPEDHAPMLIIPKPYGYDVSKKITLSVPAGTLMIFNTFLWHSASVFRASEGQRYSVTRIYGRADHYWEGVSSYTNRGRDEYFRTFIGSLTARDRELFRFPPAGHPYYNKETLALLEAQYPGWNDRNEYAPGADVEPSNYPHLLGLPIE